MPDIQRIIESVTGHHARFYRRAIEDMLVAMAMDNGPALKDARDRLNEAMLNMMSMAELIGASQALQMAAKIIPKEGSVFMAERGNLLNFANEPTQTLLPSVTFAEAVDSILSRIPTTLHQAAERTFTNIAKLYGQNSGGKARIAFVRSAETAVTHEAQSVIARAIDEGIPESSFIRSGTIESGAGKQISEAIAKVRKISGPWSESYSKMVFRTNLNTAVSAGQFRQAQDPVIKAVLPAFMFDPVMDGDTRLNHGAGDNLVFQSDHPIWKTHSAPLGYNCRCGMRLVGTPELRRMNRIDKDGNVKNSNVPTGWHADKGFRHGGRPDLMMGTV